MVDAMATLKNGGAGAGSASDTTRQMLQALRHFDAKGNLAARQANIVASLTRTDASRPSGANGGVLAINKTRA